MENIWVGGLLRRSTESYRDPPRVTFAGDSIHPGQDNAKQETTTL